MSVPDQRESHPVRQGLAGGATFAAAILLFVAGLLGLFQGISAVVNDDLIVVGPQYVYQFDTTAWGWIHIVVGVLAMIIAIGMFTGAVWARVAAIVIASLSIIANFLWLPYYPWWSILLIALDLVVIWAVATWKSA
ncbi:MULTISPECIES: DUF7144 family membrane protein [Gordonia]|uniref:DUF7144 domain-containing protein n=2 Tax=Gordonia TaxID=2053 RepID=L7LIZ3_9ACTN|nr:MULTISPECIES: hypothetical protein [Gordonia]AUH67889.1 hypothetical protein CXX93_05460 [Gordonia sp. YC-JH1]KJR07924.1 membrane protein [Gordonia sihwensis]KXT58125.1 membrane protein [Gordonia sp. QH-12]MBY4569632.1 hypothetical protein [Gordonia sihwensis]GAC60711.1 hypothetical protein GSI01S_11_00530 [Gordonia sihwensis NBRC 108236]